MTLRWCVCGRVCDAWYVCNAYVMRMWCLIHMWYVCDAYVTNSPGNLCRWLTLRNIAVERVELGAFTGCLILLYCFLFCIILNLRGQNIYQQVLISYIIRGVDISKNIFLEQYNHLNWFTTTSSPHSNLGDISKIYFWLNFGLQIQTRIPTH